MDRRGGPNDPRAHDLVSEVDVTADGAPDTVEVAADGLSEVTFDVLFPQTA